MSTSSRTNVFDPAIFAGGIPHERFRQLRDEDPVAWQEEHAIGEWPAGPGYWAVTRYDDARHVLASPADFSSWTGATQIRDPEPEDLPFIRRMILNMDPPEHLRLRRSVAGAFSRRRLEELTEAVTRRVRSALEDVASEGRCDQPVQITDDLPLANLAELLGVPASDRHLMLRWMNRVIGYQDPEHGEIVRDDRGRPVNQRPPAMLADMFAYAEEPQAAPSCRRRNERARPRRGRRPEPHGRGAQDVLLPARHRRHRHDAERPARGRPCAVEHPEAYRRLREDLDLVPAAIEEILRWHPPVLASAEPRDLELVGTHIRAGDKVVVYHVSAHYDEREFPEPFDFDIARAPNRHLACGHGPHKWLGAHFARLQMQIFLSEFMQRLPQVELDGPVQRLTSNFINRINRLQLRWRT